MNYREINKQCFCFQARRVARFVTTHYDKALISCGLKSTQFSVLISIGQFEGKSLSDVANAMCMDRTTLTRNLKPLERANLVKVMKLSDGRAKSYVLTSEGKDAIKNALPLWESANENWPRMKIAK